MINISGYGTQASIIADPSFPGGLTITQFSDDTDAIDIASQDTSNVSMSLNGDLLVAAQATAINVSMSVVASSEDDENLQILLDNNRVGKGKSATQDKVTMTITYPDGTFVTFKEGAIIGGMAGNSVASAGRLKTKIYLFAFENN
jgi:hypothetical protein